MRKRAISVMLISVALVMSTLAPAVAAHTETVTPGASCAADHEGVYGQTTTGEWMRCTTSDADEMLRWRASEEPTPPDPQPAPVEPLPVACDDFADVCGTTHESSIVAIAELAITAGYPDGTFRPDDRVSRGQMATFLANALALDVDLDLASETFSDVADTTHEPSIGALFASGITGGYPDGTFRPDDDVNRGQMATFLTSGFRLSASPIVRFSDIAGTTHLAGINAVATEGIAGGYSDSTYRPRNSVTRGQMATFLARGLELVERTTPPAEYVAPIDHGSYSSVEAYENDVLDSVYSVTGLLEALAEALDMWSYSEISDDQFVSLMDAWVEALDTHIDHFEDKTPPATHEVSFGHFTDSLDSLRLVGVNLGLCVETRDPRYCDTAVVALDAAEASMNSMWSTWPGTATLQSTGNDKDGLEARIHSQIDVVRDRVG